MCWTERALPCRDVHESRCNIFALLWKVFGKKKNPLPLFYESQWYWKPVTVEPLKYVITCASLLFNQLTHSIRRASSILLFK